MTVQCPAFELPESALLTDETIHALAAYRSSIKASIEQEAKAADIKRSRPVESRKDTRDKFYSSDVYRNLLKRYSVDVQTSSYAGVVVEKFSPTTGVTEKNKNRILINLHGGAFTSGSRTVSQLESIPVALLGNIEVISVDYRMAPEYRFPAASDDVVTVYQELIKNYSPKNIGIYGASAGAHIATQVLVQLQEQGVELPGAIALISGGAVRKVGDSIAIGGAIVQGAFGIDLSASESTYFAGIDPNNPQVTPALSDQYMSLFPPCMLASSTRDSDLSPVVATHRQLCRLGVEAELHIWEGLDHVFHYNPDLPESEELNCLIAEFFDKHLSGLNESLPKNQEKGVYRS